MSVLVNAALAALAGVIGSLLGAAVAGQKLALPIGILTGLLGYFASGALVPQQVKSTASAVSEWEEEDKAKKAKKAKKAAAEQRKKEEAAAAREAEAEAKKEAKKAEKKAAEAKAKKAAAKAPVAAVESDAESDEEADSAPKSKSAIKKAKKAAKEAAAKKEAEAAAKAAAKKGKKGAAAEPAAPATAAAPKTVSKPALTPAQEKAAAKAAAAAAAADLEGWETIEATKPTKSQLAKASAAVSSPTPAGKAKKAESIPSSERPLTEDIVIPIKQHSLIIGTGGKTLATLQEGSGAQIDMPKKESASSKITITGTPAQVAAAKNAIQSLADRGFSSITHPGVLSDDITVEPNQVGLILGEKGKFLRQVQEVTKARINLPEKGSTTNKKVTIVGEKEAVKAAKAALRSLLQDGFSSITHEGWTKVEVDFPSEKFGILIGPSGNTIKSIQKETSTRINLPEKNSKSSSVSICGLPENINKVRARFEKMLEPPAPLPDPEEEDLATDDAWGQEHTARGEDALWA